MLVKKNQVNNHFRIFKKIHKTIKHKNNNQINKIKVKFKLMNLKLNIKKKKKI